jgi:hypothetical protein
MKRWGVAVAFAVAAIVGLAALVLRAWYIISEQAIR